MLIRAFVDRASTSATPADTLRDIRDKALAAVEAGDQEITTTSFEGGMATGSRKFNATQLLEIVQLALEEIEGCAEPKFVQNDFSRRWVQA